MRYIVKFENWKDEEVLGEFNNFEEAQVFANQKYDELIWDEAEEDIVIYDKNDNKIYYTN